jgi:hypothetical protein
LFSPDPRTKGRQYACSAPACQKQRKIKNHLAWLAKNPGYFKGRYRKTRSWWEKHPGYITEYRREHPEARKKHAEAERRRRKKRAALAVDIQDVISLQELAAKGLKSELPCVDKQDSISTELLVVTGLTSRLQRADSVDIQDANDVSLATCYNLGRKIWDCARTFLGRACDVHARKTASAP